MGFKFDLKETVKALILAPVAGALAGVATAEVTGALSSLPGAVITAANGIGPVAFGGLVGAFTFGVILYDALDDILVDNSADAPK
jgi:hypothetical protein